MTPDAVGRKEIRDRLRDEPPPSDEIVVVRGGRATVEKLRTHARRTHRAWCLDGQPIYGISVFCALDDIGPASLRSLLSGYLVTYRLVHVLTVADVLAAGFKLLATGRRPHFTVLLSSDEDAELGRLLACLGEPQDNRYYLSRRFGPPRRT